MLLSGTFLPFATKRVPLSVNRTNQSFKMIAQTPNIINKRILQIAVPSIISNITVPLLGLIDVTIVGHLGAAAYIGAIAVGGMLFNIIYWIFGFLRMGTSGMTSQAYGKHDLDEVARLLLRSVGVGLLIAIILVALQYPIRKLAFTFIQTTEEVERFVKLDNFSQGAGLGLSICRIVAERLGGYLRIDKGYTQGTRVIFCVSM